MDNAADSKLGHIAIEAEMSASYIDYSMSVIAGRALPDARDGLKPVHRRVLFAMRELGNTHGAAYKKSARVVGDVIGKYHPHGDTAVYDTIVRMAQDFSMRYPLVDGQGNFGSRDGDAPAAMRYTEVRMDRMAEELLADIDKNTVDFGPNYDESLTQPLVLPSRLPNLLLNGSTGIAVGMATNVPPHNLCEVVNGTIHLIDHRDAGVSDLMQFIKGPDFPTYGVICGMTPVEQMYHTGKGQLRVRGRATIEDDNGKPTIIVTELPYTVNKARLIENIADLVQNKTLEGISDIRDESNSKEPVRIVIDLRRGTLPDIVLNNLFMHTQLETTFGAIMLALVDGRPRVLNLKELLECFVAHRFEVVTRRTRYDLEKAEARAHILEGLLKALDILDQVVRAIRESRNREEAHAQLVARFAFSDAQTKAILDMRLYQLTGLEREKVEGEYRELQQQIAYFRDLLAHEDKIYGVIKDELRELRERYGDARRTELQPAHDDVLIEDLIADEPCIITISHAGYIKRGPTDAYRAQRRGGKGVAGMTPKEEDYVEHLFTAYTHDSILFFTRGGRVYVEKVYQIPEAARASRGKAVVNLLNLREEEKIAAMLKVRDLSAEQSVVMATEKGVIKKTNLAAFGNVRRDGIIAINIDADDHLIEVRLTNGTDEIILTTEQGMSIRFSETQAREQGRATRGVRGIRLHEGDRVKSLAIVDPESTLMLCTANGYGKRTSFDEWRLTNRGGLGVIAIRTSERNGNVVGARAVRENECLMLITANGKMIKTPVSDIGVIGRATQGVRLINLEEGDSLVSATAVEPDEEDAGPEADGAEAPPPPA